MRVITDRDYVRDYINIKLDEILDKLSKDEDISIEEKYIGAKVVKELNEVELTDDEIVNLYNACDYNKFINLIEALKSADVLNCGNTNEMIRKLATLIWCHYENSVDAAVMCSIVDDNILTTLDEIAAHLKDEEDKENKEDTELEYDLETFDDSPFGSNPFNSNPFGSSQFGSNPFDSSTLDDVFGENTKKDDDKQKEIKKAYKKLEKAFDTLKDIIDGD